MDSSTIDALQRIEELEKEFDLWRNIAQERAGQILNLEVALAREQAQCKLRTQALDLLDEQEGRIEELEAACAEMREALLRLGCRPHQPAEYHCIISQALAPDAGRGWMPPEKVAKLRALADEIEAAGPGSCYETLIANKIRRLLPEPQRSSNVSSQIAGDLLPTKIEAFTVPADALPATAAVTIGGGAATFDRSQISDGYHTFAELYEHRHALWIALCYFREDCWRSRRHSDGELAFGGGWFVLGMGTMPGQQITYHLPESLWDACHFAEELEQAPEFDGHTSADVMQRLKAIVP